MIIDMKLPGVTLEQEADAAAKLKIMREDIGPLTAERIYRYMKHNPLTAGEKQDLQRLFSGMFIPCGSLRSSLR